MKDLIKEIMELMTMENYGRNVTNNINNNQNFNINIMLHGRCKEDTMNLTDLGKVHLFFIPFLYYSMIIKFAVSRILKLTEMGYIDTIIVTCALLHTGNSS